MTDTRFTYLVVDGVPLGDEHAVDTAFLAARGSGEVAQRAIKLRELVDRLVSHQRLADENDLVRVVRRDKLRESARAKSIVATCQSRSSNK